MTAGGENTLVRQGKFERWRWCEAALDQPEVVSVSGGTVAVFTTPKPAASRANQDAMLLVTSPPRGPTLLAVADGAGGMPAGERAATAAIDALAARVLAAFANEQPLREGILMGFEDANRAVLALGVGAATTLVAAEVTDGEVRPYHAGDSRALVCGQRGKFKLLTVAHSPVGYQVEAGLLEEDEALHHGALHVVSNLVGTADLRVEMGSRLRLNPFDTLVLASDGLFDNLNPEEIVATVRKGSLLGAAGALIETASARMVKELDGHPSKPDDLTFLVFRPDRNVSAGSPNRSARLRSR